MIVHCFAVKLLPGRLTNEIQNLSLPFRQGINNKEFHALLTYTQTGVEFPMLKENNRKYTYTWYGVLQCLQSLTAVSRGTAHKVAKNAMIVQ